MQNKFPSSFPISACLAAVMLVSSFQDALAQLNIATTGVTYTINFDGTVSGVSNGAWAGSGFQPVPSSGRLSSNAWRVSGWSDGNLVFGGTATTGDFARGISSGGTAVGGMYAFQGAPISGRALGFQPGVGDWQPGTIILRLQNNTGSTLSAFDVAYKVFVRNDQDRSSVFEFAYGTDDVTFTTVPALDLTSPGPSSGTAWVQNDRSTTVSGFSVPSGGYFYVRWRSAYVSGTGGYDEFALDDIQLTGYASTTVKLSASSVMVNENDGTTPINVVITNPSSVNSTMVDLVLISGSAARIGNYTTQTVTFPANSGANQTVNITLSDNGACDGDEVLVFQLQNVSGGSGIPTIEAPSQFTLTIDDDEVTVLTYAQFFDGLLSDNWSITNGAGSISSNTGPADVPANQRVLSPSSSWQVNNATSTLVLGNVGLAGFSGITLTARVSCTGNNSIQGAELGDDVRIYVALNGGAFPATPDITITGNSNARWGYATGSGVASTTAGTPVTFTPAGGGDRTTDGYSHVQISIPDGTSLVRLRVIARNNNIGEIWSLDNVQVTGSLCRPIYYSRANGSETGPVWSTSRTGAPAAGAVTFDKNATMVVQATHTITSTGSPIDLRNMIVETGGSLNLGGTTVMTTYGPQFTVDGSLTSADDDFKFQSDVLTTIGGTTSPIDMHNVTLDGFGAKVAVNTLRIFGTLQLNNGDFDGNLKEVQLISTPSGTANLGPVAPTASYTSRLRLERYIPAGVTNWRLLCSPIMNKTVVDWMDDFITAGFPGSTFPNFDSPPGSNILWPSVRMYDETNVGPNSSDGLIGVPSSAQPLTPGRGFAAWSGTSLTTTTAFVVDVRGTPVVAHAPIALPMTYTNTGTPAVDGLNLVGNPLASPIDFGSISRGANVDNFYYVFDPISGTNATWDESLSLSIPAATLNGNIQSSQGFWLHASGPAVTTTVTESAKVTDASGGGLFGGEQEAPAPMVRLRLNGSGSYYDETLVHFGVGDPDQGIHDISKFDFSDQPAPSISTLTQDGARMVLNAWGTLDTNADIPVLVDVSQTGTYTLTVFDAETLLGITCMVLEDLEDGTMIPLEEGTQYSFVMNAGAPSDVPRFMLHASKAIDFEAEDASCAASNDGTAMVSGIGQGPWDYTWLGAFGNVIAQEMNASGTSSLNGLAPGVYAIQVDGNAGCGMLTHSFVITAPAPLAAQADVTPASCDIASNGSVDLQVMGGTAPYSFDWSNGGTDEDLAAVPPGSYTVTITDANGCTSQVVGQIVGFDAGPSAQFEVADSLVMAGEPVEFFNYSTYGLDYLWDFSDGTTSTESEPYHTFDLPGTYNVSLVAIDGDCSATFTMDVEVNTSTSVWAGATIDGINAWSDGGSFVLLWHDQTADTKGVEVLGTDGRVVAATTISGPSGRLSIPASGLSSGVYLLRVTPAQGVSTMFKLAHAQ